jgi:hypothetical protein
MARGQPGEEVYTPQVTPEDLPRKIVPRMEQENVLGGFADAAEATAKKFTADSATYAGDQLSQFRQQQVAALEQMKQQAPAGDPGNFTERYLQQFDKGAQTLAQGPATQNNPIVRQMLERGVGQLRDTLADHTLEWEATQRKQYQLDSIQQNLDAQLPLVRAHPELAQQVGSTLNDQTQATILNPADKYKVMTNFDKALTREAALGKVDQNPGGVYQQLQMDSPTDPVIAAIRDPQVRQEVKDKATAGLVHQLAGAAVTQYQQSPEAGQAAFAAVDKLTLDKDPVENERLQQEVRASINQQRGELIQQNQQTHASDVIRLEESLKTGNVDPSRRGQIWGGYRSGWLTPEQTGSMLGEDSRINLAHATDGAGMALIDQAFAGKIVLDPKNPEQKLDANNWFIDHTQNIPIGSEQYTNLAAEFAHRTGMVPDAVGAYTRAMLVGDTDPAKVMNAAEIVARMREAAPRAFEYLDDDHKLGAMADSITRLTTGGMDPTKAVQIARDNYAAGEGDKKRLGELWEQKRPLGAHDSALDSVLSSAVSGNPNLTQPGWIWGRNPLPHPPAMQADFETLTRQYFDHNGGDATAAEAAAARDIGTVWGITKMNGSPELVKYPPERMFRAPDGGPGLTSEDIRTDLAQTVANHPEAFQHWDEEKHTLVPFKVDPDKVQLVQSERTVLTHGVTWGLSYVGPDGVAESLYGKDGKPLQFDLPVKREDYAAMRTQAVQERVKQAKAAYDAQTASEAKAREALQADADQSRAGLGAMR